MCRMNLPIGWGTHFGKVISKNGALMVQSGLAYSLVIEGSVPFLDKEKIIFRPVSPRLTSNSVLAWKKTTAVLSCGNKIYLTHEMPSKHEIGIKIKQSLLLMIYFFIYILQI